MEGMSLMVLWHRLLGAALLPPVLNLLPIVAGAMLVRRWQHAGRVLLALGVALTYMLSIPQTAIWLAQGVERYPPIRPADLAAADAIVVLGGGKRPAPEFGGNAPSSDTLARLRYAAYLARQSGKPVLVTGGSPLGGEPEGKVMASALHDDYGIRARWVEDRSDTTLDNARLSAEMLKAAGATRIALVSQGWHWGGRCHSSRAKACRCRRRRPALSVTKDRHSRVTFPAARRWATATSCCANTSVCFTTACG